MKPYQDNAVMIYNGLLDFPIHGRLSLWLVEQSDKELIVRDFAVSESRSIPPDLERDSNKVLSISKNENEPRVIIMRGLAIKCLLSEAGQEHCANTQKSAPVLCVEIPNPRDII